MIVFLLLEDSENPQHTQAIAAGKVRIGMHPRNLSPKTLKKDYVISIQPSLKIKHNDALNKERNSRMQFRSKCL